MADNNHKVRRGPDPGQQLTQDYYRIGDLDFHTHKPGDHRWAYQANYSDADSPRGRYNEVRFFEERFARSANGNVRRDERRPASGLEFLEIRYSVVDLGLARHDHGIPYQANRLGSRVCLNDILTDVAGANKVTALDQDYVWVLFSYGRDHYLLASITAVPELAAVARPHLALRLTGVKYGKLARAVHDRARLADTTNRACKRRNGRRKGRAD